MPLKKTYMINKLTMIRTDVINKLITKNTYNSYLEIGTKNLMNFSRVKCENKHGVDRKLDNNITKYGKGYEMSSDVYFASLTENEKFDLIFIDGSHTYDYVLRDLSNSLKHLNDNGIVVMHDCNPPTAAHENISGKLCGTVWKAFYNARKNYDKEAYVVDTIDYGCGVIHKTLESYILPSLNTAALDYTFLTENRVSVLNLITTDVFLQRHNS